MLYIFTEGPDDERLIFNHLFKDIEDKKSILYANRKQKYISSLIKSIEKSNDDYIFFCDSDSKSVSDRRQEKMNKYNISNPEKIIVVDLEIESWYYSGASEELCKNLKIKYKYSDGNISKERLANLIKNSNYTRTEILITITNNFLKSLACERNQSFLFFDNLYKKTYDKNRVLSLCK